MAVLRRALIRYCLRPSFKSEMQTLSVWAVFSARERTPLMRNVGRLNQTESMNLSMTIYCHSWRPATAAPETGNSILLEENCGPHRAITVVKYMTLHGVKQLQWDPQSPDMNPIESAWGVLEDHLRARPRMPSKLAELLAALREEWGCLPASFFDSLCQSMRTRVGAMLRARGHPTKKQVNRTLKRLGTTLRGPMSTLATIRFSKVARASENICDDPCTACTLLRGQILAMHFLFKVHNHMRALIFRSMKVRSQYSATQIK